MGIFTFLRKRRDEIHAEAPTTTSLAYHTEHEVEKSFVFGSPPVPKLKLHTVPTYEEHLEGEVEKARQDLSYSFSDFHDALSNVHARDRLDKAELDLKDYRSELELASKIPFTKDDIQNKQGEFDNLIARLKDHQLETDVARDDFYGSSYSQEDVEYAENYDEMRCAEFCEKFTENEIDDAKDQISHMTLTLDSNHDKLNDAWNKSNEVNQADHELER